MERVIIDTDPGVDDAAAIYWLLSRSSVDVVGVTTVFGNIELSRATVNAEILLTEADRDDIPVYAGCAGPLVGEPTFAKHVHGDTGLGGFVASDPTTSRVAQTAGPVALLEMLDRHEAGEVTILGLGPLTNLAVAYRLDPDTFQKAKRVIYMGGAVATWGNVTPRASANISNDPDAAATVVGSGVPLVQIGLDVCRKFLTPPEEMDQIRVNGGRPGGVLHEMINGASGRGYDRSKARHPFGVKSGVYFNDGPCTGFLLYPELFDAEEFHVAIERHGEHSRGETVVDVEGVLGLEPNVTVCMDVDGEKLTAAFVRDMCAQS